MRTISLQKTTDVTIPDQEEWIADCRATVFGMSRTTARELYREEFLDVDWYENETYLVSLRDLLGGQSKLSIERHDKAACHSWDDFQRIKNTLFGPEREAIELYPAESRLVDCANKYHLLILPEGARFDPFGWNFRAVR